MTIDLLKIYWKYENSKEHTFQKDKELLKVCN
jgi:hypothetical protein